MDPNWAKWGEKTLIFDPSRGLFPSDAPPGTCKFMQIRFPTAPGRSKLGSVLSHGFVAAEIFKSHVVWNHRIENQDLLYKDKPTHIIYIYILTYWFTIKNQVNVGKYIVHPPKWNPRPTGYLCRKDWANVHHTAWHLPCVAYGALIRQRLRTILADVILFWHETFNWMIPKIILGSWKHAPFMFFFGLFPSIQRCLARSQQKITRRIQTDPNLSFWHTSWWYATQKKQNEHTHILACPPSQ